MTKTIDEHLQDAKQKGERITNLDKQITESETLLGEKEKEYETAVINDESNIDDLFNEISKLKDKIKADKHRLKTLRDVTEVHLRQNAVDIVEDYPKLLPKYKTRARVVQQNIQAEIDRHNEVIGKLRAEGEAINDDYENESARYLSLLERHKIGKGYIKTNPYPGGQRPDLDEKDRTAENLAYQNKEIINKNLYMDIENSAMGHSKAKPFKFNAIKGVNTNG